jgi:hypothetical protein
MRDSAIEFGGFPNPSHGARLCETLLQELLWRVLEDLRRAVARHTLSGVRWLGYGAGSYYRAINPQAKLLDPDPGPS